MNKANIIRQAYLQGHITKQEAIDLLLVQEVVDQQQLDTSPPNHDTALPVEYPRGRSKLFKS